MCYTFSKSTKVVFIVQGIWYFPNTELTIVQSEDFHIITGESPYQRASSSRGTRLATLQVKACEPSSVLSLLVMAIVHNTYLTKEFRKCQNLHISLNYRYYILKMFQKVLNQLYILDTSGKSILEGFQPMLYFGFNSEMLLTGFN